MEKKFSLPLTVHNRSLFTPFMNKDSSKSLNAFFKFPNLP